MGKRKHRDPAEREAREARRAERSDRSIQQKVEQVAAAEYASRLRHALLEAGVNPEDIVKLDAEGFVGKHAHVTGELSISVTPPDENGTHDPTTTTG